MKVEEEEKEKEEEEDESDLIFCEKPYFSDRVSYLKGFHPWREGATHCDLCSQLYIYAESKQHGPPYCFIGMNSKQRQHIHQTCAAFFPKLCVEVCLIYALQHWVQVLCRFRMLLLRVVG